MADLANVKIVMLAPCLGKFGGIETFCLTLIEDLIRKGAVVKLLRKKVSGFEDDQSILKNECEIRSAWTKEEGQRFSSQWVTPRDAEIKNAIQDSDLVHLHNPMVEGVWYAKKLSKPCVMTIYNWRRRGIHPRLWAWNWAVGQADRRWYISEFVWDSWEKKKRQGSGRLPVVSQMPQEETSPDKRKGFLFIGRWVPNKGIRILLEAYARIKADPKEWPLTMVGDGPLREEVLATIQEKGIQGVHLPGFISESDRHCYTREAKWMVTPPHTQEDLGLTPLEARSVGVPCIATTDGGIKETAGIHALFCKPGDVNALAECLTTVMQMEDAQYEERSKLAKEDLEQYVRPLDE
ncbi:MAG: glycosyltransferase family 4 protein, partial [Opitutales bacterium]|nr:glycosyltransferase family 4 protein [Opitutales bacterium]